MNILFIHKDFPGQFKYLAPILAQDPMNLVLFLTSNDTIQAEAGINKLVYKLPPEHQGYMNPCLKNYEKASLHARGVANMLLLLKSRNIVPDIIYAHNGDVALFVKDIFPNVPLICYCEWIDSPDSPAIKFGGKEINDSYKEQLRCENASKISVLARADGCISPTEWQKSQFPKEFHHKIQVIHDGVNTDGCAPDENAEFIVPEKGIKLTAKDEVITYATRGMEPVRGFPEFIQAAEKILKKRPNAHIIVGGNDKVFYGEPLKKGTYKELMLSKLDLDLSRLHFVGGLNFNEYLKLLQISSAHIYATYPFILSWSIIEAMSVACPVIASSTEPVLEVIKDNYNGLLYDFFDVDMMVEKIEFALDNKDKMQETRQNARKTAIEKYDLKNLLVQQICYLQTKMIKSN